MEDTESSALRISAVDDVWTEERIRAFGVRMPTKDAYKAISGCGDSKAYELIRSGEDLGVRVLRKGRQYVTPTADVLRVLGLDDRLSAA